MHGVVLSFISPPPPPGGYGIHKMLTVAALSYFSHTPTGRGVMTLTSIKW